MLFRSFCDHTHIYDVLRSIVGWVVCKKQKDVRFQPGEAMAGTEMCIRDSYYAERIHGLELPGMVLLEQIKTIDKRRVKKYLGRMTRQQMDEIGEAIEEALGLYVPEEMEAP